jgi:hypothetical protein
LARFEFESGTVSFCFTFIFVSFGESRLLVSWCAGSRCGMTCSGEDHGRSRRPGIKDRGRVLGGRAIERSGGAMCGVHRARGDEEHRFLGRALKPRSMVCEWFGLKTTQMVFTSLASKPVASVFSSFASKLVATVSPSLASKPAVGFLVEPQN